MILVMKQTLLSSPNTNIAKRRSSSIENPKFICASCSFFFTKEKTIAVAFYLHKKPLCIDVYLLLHNCRTCMRLHWSSSVPPNMSWCVLRSNILAQELVCDLNIRHVTTKNQTKSSLYSWHYTPRRVTSDGGAYPRLSV